MSTSVDDFTLVSEDINVILRTKEALKAAYNMIDLGELTYILGMHIKRDRKAGWIELPQERYIEDILESYGKPDVRQISTPALTNEHLTKLTTLEIDVKSLQRALGAIVYPMLGTRPDLAYFQAVGALGRHAATPGDEHQRALDRVFRHLRATKDWRLVYQRGVPEGLTLTGYADADWANDLGDRKSTSGDVFKLAGGAISWSSKKHPSVALSSTEAEYIAGAHAAKELVWLRCLFGEVGLSDDDPTISNRPAHGQQIGYRDRQKPAGPPQNQAYQGPTPLHTRLYELEFPLFVCRI